MSQPAVHSWSKGLTDVLYSTGRGVKEQRKLRDPTVKVDSTLNVLNIVTWTDSLADSAVFLER